MRGKSDRCERRRLFLLFFFFFLIFFVFSRLERGCFGLRGGHWGEPAPAVEDGNRYGPAPGRPLAGPGHGSPRALARSGLPGPRRGGAQPPHALHPPRTFTEFFPRFPIHKDARICSRVGLYYFTGLRLQFRHWWRAPPHKRNEGHGGARLLVPAALERCIDKYLECGSVVDH